MWGFCCRVTLSTTIVKTSSVARFSQDFVGHFVWRHRIRRGDKEILIAGQYWFYWLLLLDLLQWRHDERDSVSNHQRLDCLFNHLFRCRSKKTSKPRVTGLREGYLPVTSGCLSQRASKAENVYTRWRHHETPLTKYPGDVLLYIRLEAVLLQTYLALCYYPMSIKSALVDIKPKYRNCRHWLSSKWRQFRFSGQSKWTFWAPARSEHADASVLLGRLYQSALLIDHGVPRGRLNDTSTYLKWNLAFTWMSPRRPLVGLLCEYPIIIFHSLLLIWRSHLLRRINLIPSMYK